MQWKGPPMAQKTGRPDEKNKEFSTIIAVLRSPRPRESPNYTLRTASSICHSKKDEIKLSPS